uniref:Uncharacterized protein n=1 Tax=Coccidioides posadasii RMSCC 3488 TaxID=454284 RepID=A0A0J6HXT8_COCPO|nr:hypothetical protein CPAG_00121 [Coccidioides posadasii RMSCC 3488]
MGEARDLSGPLLGPANVSLSPTGLHVGASDAGQLLSQTHDSSRGFLHHRPSTGEVGSTLRRPDGGQTQVWSVHGIPSMIYTAGFDDSYIFALWAQLVSIFCNDRLTLGFATLTAITQPETSVTELFLQNGPMLGHDVTQSYLDYLRV